MTPSSPQDRESELIEVLPSLRKRVVGATAWRIGGFGVSQAIRFGSNLILTRLLAPEVFGLMSIATIVFSGLQMFSDVGLRQSVIHSKRGDERSFLDTAWSIQLLRGATLTSISLCIAIGFAVAQAFHTAEKTVYSNAKLPYIIAALSVIALIDGLNSTKLIEANRKLLFNYVTALEICAQIMGLACTMTWAILAPSIWALVAGTIFSVLTTCVMSHFFIPGTRNRWQWDVSAATEIVHFGKWILISSVFGFLISNGDRLILGGLVTPHALGLYVIAYTIYSSLEQVVTKLISDVMFPALSEIARTRPDRLIEGHGRLFVATASSLYFCSGALVFGGASLIHLLYDMRYQESGWILQILAIGLLMTPYYVTATSLLALGHSKIYSHLIAIRAAALFLLVPAGYFLAGLPGAVIAIVASYFSNFPVVVLSASKYGLFEIRSHLLPAGTFVCGALAGSLFAHLM